MMPHLGDEAEVVVRGQGEHSLQKVSVVQRQLGGLTLHKGALQTLGVSNLCVGHQQGCVGVCCGFQAGAPHHVQHRPCTVQVTEGGVSENYGKWNYGIRKYWNVKQIH